LDLALTYGSEMEGHVKSDYMINVMDSCNTKKMNSRRVSDGCEKIFMALYLKNHLKETDGVVIEISQSNSFRFINVYIKEYEIQVKVDFSEISAVQNLVVSDDETNP
jgi:hypothetical protein